MNVRIDPDCCLGCGICESIEPEVFHLGSRLYSIVLLNPVPQQYWKAVHEAVEKCPEEAISIEEDRLSLEL